MINDSGWRIDKNINISVLLMGIALLGSFIWWNITTFTGISSTLVRHDTEIIALQEQQKDIKTEMNKRFDKLDDKLDVLIQQHEKIIGMKK